MKSYDSVLKEKILNTNIRLYGESPYKTAVVHGGPGALGSVAPIARELSKYTSVIEPLQTKLSIDELIEELDDAIDAYCDTPTTLIGHSWGAWLVFSYAAKYSHRVKKIILVGSGPFETKYVSKIGKTRRQHFTSVERIEFDNALKGLNSDNKTKSNEMMNKLGSLVEKSDNYCMFELASEKDDCLQAVDGMYKSIWGEAAELRKTGALLDLADEIKCSVVAIHGDYDPHPIDGVRIPLQNRLTDFKLYTLSKCGHNPWKEKYAYREFYNILKREIDSHPIS